MPELTSIQKDLIYTEKKLDELVSDFKSRDPAKETYSFITEVKLTMKGQTDEIKNLTKTLDTHVADQRQNDAELKTNIDNFHTSILGKIDVFIETSDERYASKETEKVLKKINWLIISSVVIAVLAIVLAAGYIVTTHKY